MSSPSARFSGFIFGEHGPHPTYEKVLQMSDDELIDFVEEVELNDADVYWGVEY